MITKLPLYARAEFAKVLHCLQVPCCILALVRCTSSFCQTEKTVVSEVPLLPQKAYLKCYDQKVCQCRV